VQLASLQEAFNTGQIQVVQADIEVGREFPMHPEQDRAITYVRALANLVSLSLHTQKMALELQRNREEILADEEDWRHKMARDLHDGPVQRVAAIAMQADFIMALLRNQPDRAPEELQQLRENALQTAQELRTLNVKRLREQDNLNITFYADPLPKLDETLEQTVFAIVQEAIGNAKKHAKGAPITVRVERTARGLLVQVQDEGPGFDVEEVKRTRARHNGESLRAAMSPLAWWPREIWLALLLASTLFARSGVRWFSLTVRGAPIRYSRQATRWRALLARTGIRTALRWSVYLGLPYVALLSGLLFPHELGLVWPPRYIWGQTMVALIGLGSLGTAMFGHAALAWPRHQPPPECRLWQAPFGFFLFWPDILLVHAHWAFYRAVVMVFTGAAGMSALLGLVFIVLEWGLDPAWWRRLQRPHLAMHPLFRCMMAILAAVGRICAKWVCPTSTRGALAGRTAALWRRLLPACSLRPPLTHASPQRGLLQRQLLL